MTYLCALLLTLLALVLAFVRRGSRAEAATIIVVSLPVVLAVSHNAPVWLESFRKHYRLDAADAVALAPPVVTRERNLPLATRALEVIPSDGTYALVSDRATPRNRAAARRERARLTYLDSWLQYWLAPRIRATPADAQWLIVLGADSERPLSAALELYRIGGDLLVRRK